MMESAPKRRKITEETHVATVPSETAAVGVAKSKSFEPAAFFSIPRRSNLPEPTDDEVDRIPDKKLAQVIRMIKCKVTYMKIRQAAPATFVDIPHDVPYPIKIALSSCNFRQLYAHQTLLREQVREGKDVIITTPTSSGKSVAFHLPVLESFFNDQERSSALFIFPLKALAVDQTNKLKKLASYLPYGKAPKIWTVTGDVPEWERTEYIKKMEPDIVICSPDLLHWQIWKHQLQVWRHWRRFLARLKFVVLDEAHAYRGLFGGNIANMIRRLRNALDDISPGSSQRLQFIIASATVGNPLSLAQRLLSKTDRPDDIAYISDNAAPRHSHVYLTHVAERNTKRAVADLVDKFIHAGLRGIVFMKTVRGANNLFDYITETNKKSENPDDEPKPAYDDLVRSSVKPYYASLNPRLKSSILRDFDKGRIKFLLSTSALEAGVDFPQTDVCIITGFPSSKLSFFQRSGRAGRSGSGITVFVPYADSGSDFYYTEHPENLLDDSNIEHIAFNPNYPTLVRAHLAWLLRESTSPRHKTQLDKIFETDTQIHLDDLVSKRIIEGTMDGFYSFVFHATLPTISFRGGDADVPPVRAVDMNDTDLIERVKRLVEAEEKMKKNWRAKTELDEAKKGDFSGVIETVSSIQIFTRLFPGALFKSLQPKEGVSGGQLYRVEKLEPEHGLALLAPVTLTKKEKLAEQRSPHITSTVTLLENPVVPQRHKVFSILGRSDATLQVTFSWSRVHEQLVGYTQQDKRQDEEDQNDRRPAVVIEYPEPFKMEYEAPAIRLSFSPMAITVISETATKSLLWMTGNEILRNSKLKEVEFENHIDVLKSDPKLVAVHTLVHQLINVVPLITMSSSEFNSNDVREHSISSNCDQGFLVDSAAGGNGACERLFDNFELAIEMALQRSMDCCYCAYHDRRAFGCAACLYETGSRCILDSVGLVSAFGAEALQLSPVQSNPIADSELAEDETTVGESSQTFFEFTPPAITDGACSTM